MGPFIHCLSSEQLPYIRSVLGEIKWSVFVLRKLAGRRGSYIPLFLRSTGTLLAWLQWQGL